MKRIAAVMCLLLISASAWGHGEGHDPIETTSPKQGGVLAPIVMEADASKKSTPFYRGELVYNKAGKTRLYLYDDHMHKIPANKFGSQAKGVLVSCKKDKCSEETFDMQVEGGEFAGVTPKPKRTPFTINVYFSEGAKKLFGSFKNLD